MSVNSQSSFAIFRGPPHLASSNDSVISLYLECQNSIASHVIYTTYTFTSVLLLPLYILVFYMGFQRWRSQSPGTTSHSDVLTYHMVTVETLSVFGSVFYTLGAYTNNGAVTMLGVFVFGIIFPGQAYFQCLTCVEHYLAVVQPITYLRLRETGGVRIRNVSIGCGWLLCLGWIAAIKLYLPDFPAIPFLSFMGVSVMVTMFCCLSVLHVLTHPGPGEMGGHEVRVDQSKQRAFFIISVIAGVLLLKLVMLLVGFSLYILPSMHLLDICVLMDLGIWFTLPCSLVLPLLFLQRAGKLSCPGRIRMRSKNQNFLVLFHK